MAGGGSTAMRDDRGRCSARAWVVLEGELYCLCRVGGAWQVPGGEGVQGRGVVVEVVI